MAAGTGSLLGNTTTFALSSGSVGTILSMKPGKQSIAVIPDDGLATTSNHQVKPGLLTTYDMDELTVVFNPDSIPTKGSVVTGTVTFAPRTGQTVGATKAGTGFVCGFEEQEIANDTRIVATVNWQFDGKTGPTYTAGT
jgi:hypothetical protein